MAIEATGNSSLQKLASTYKATDKETEEKEDYLGREDFLTMLVAQLQNQDPLNPMEGSDFSAQLAQFSQLEQLVNLNDGMEKMTAAFEESSQIDVTGYVGKEVTGRVDTIEVTSGAATSGYYELTETSDIMVTIYNEEGNPIQTLYPGQKGPGEYSIEWDGKDYQGNVVEDGAYTYDVMANNGEGFASLSTTKTGTVDGIIYQGGQPYLMVDGLPINPESIVSVSTPEPKETPMSPLDYLGQNISYSDHILAVDGENITGEGIRFELETQENTVIQIFDADGNEVNRLEIPAESTVTGENVVQWEGTDSAGNSVSDGIYSYAVTSESGNVQLVNSGEVTGIKYINDTQYLVVGDHGDIVSLSSITGVN